MQKRMVHTAFTSFKPARALQIGVLLGLGGLTACSTLPTPQAPAQSVSTEVLAGSVGNNLDIFLPSSDRLGIQKNATADQEKAFAFTTANNIAYAMAAVEAFNPSSNGQDASCYYTNGQVAVASGAQKLVVSAAAPITDVVCTSTNTLFAVTTIIGNQIYTVATPKNPAKLIARTVATNILTAMAAVEAYNPTSNGNDISCGYASSVQKVWVSSGTQQRILSAPAPINLIDCSGGTLTQFQVKVGTSDGQSVTLTAPKNTSKTLARAAATNILGAMASAEEANPYTNGMDAVCSTKSSQVIVTSGAQKRTLNIAAPVLVSTLSCVNSSTEFWVSIGTSNGQIVEVKAQKDPVKAAVRAIGLKAIAAMQQLEADNPIATGDDVVCSYIDGTLTVASGATITSLAIPAPVTGLVCLNTINEFSVTLSTTTGQTVTAKVLKSPDFVVAQNLARLVANNMYALEVNNPSSNGADAVCIVNLPNLTLRSGAETFDTVLPAQVTGVSCINTLTHIDVTISTSSGVHVTARGTK
ncbi:hypothetical protein [Deinococcus roseus]|uniref:Uncharacterized protein n=1 Tax=Deinococcus roseus TaxID=392414 RepID=A0ABQ2CZU9_9DEIO|nr:hypothetical protein [Deinococcus roseus]GGJ32782.1 hypothetical protein GCM10008938_18710 [Deinococcus roseus]